MAFPSYTYTFTNGSTADATQVNQNFSDILNGISNTTKDISVNAITAGGTTTLNGSVVLGVSTSSDLTFNGSIATSIPVKTNTSFDVGTATLGLRSVYIGGTSTFTTRIIGAATATWTLTLPTTAGTGGLFLQTDGTGVTTWANVSSPLLIQTLGLAATCATNAMTVALKTLSGADPTAALPVYAAFRNSTAATGQYSVISQTAALSITIPSGATIGQVSNVNQYVWVYLINDAGTLDIGVSSSVFDDGTLNACTQIGAGVSSATTLYTSISHTGSKATRLIGRILVNEATAGTWASNPTEIALNPTPRLNRTEPVSYSAAFVGFGTMGSIVAESCRDGRFLCGSMTYIAGASTGVTASVSIGFNGSSANVTMNTDAGAASTIVGQYGHSGSQQAGSMLFISGTSTTLLFFSSVYAAAAGGNASALGNAVISTSGTGTLNYRVPIVGWTTYGP